jgi:hypothetical protein
MCASEENGDPDEDWCENENVNFWFSGTQYEKSQYSLGYLCAGKSYCGVVDQKGVNAMWTVYCYVGATACGW